MAGEQWLAVTLTVPEGADEAWVRLYNGATAGNGDVYWDDLMLVEGVYDGPYQDGDSPGWVWRAGAHQSASIGYPALS